MKEITHFWCHVAPATDLSSFNIWRQLQGCSKSKPLHNHQQIVLKLAN